LFNLRPLKFAPAGEEERAAPGQPAAGDKAPDLAAIQKQFDDLKKQNQTLEEESRTWHGRYQELAHSRAVGSKVAEGGDPDEDEEDAADEAEADLPEGALLDELSKGQIGALVKKGVLTKKDAAALIDKQARQIVREEIVRARSSITHEQKLLKKHPEIDDPNSELFKAVRARMHERGNPAIYRDPENFADLVDLVAEKLKLKTNGASRSAAIAAQQGATGGGSSSSFDDDDDDQLSPTQRAMLNAFNSDGEFTISEESFKKRARAGVKMDGATAYAMHQFEKRGGRRG
jgi:hypothetical protein